MRALRWLRNLCAAKDSVFTLSTSYRRQNMLSSLWVSVLVIDSKKKSCGRFSLCLSLNPSKNICSRTHFEWAQLVLQLSEPFLIVLIAVLIAIQKYRSRNQSQHFTDEGQWYLQTSICIVVVNAELRVCLWFIDSHKSGAVSGNLHWIEFKLCCMLLLMYGQSINEWKTHRISHKAIYFIVHLNLNCGTF